MNLPDKNINQSENFKKNDIIKEVEGSLKKQGNKKDKLMSSTTESNEKNQGKLIQEAVNRSIGSFTPDIMFQNIVQNYKNAKKLYGETIIRELTDFEPGFIEKNIQIPEFKKEIKKNISLNINRLQESKILNANFELTEKAYELSAEFLCELELDKLKSLGHAKSSESFISENGEFEYYEQFKNQRFKSISIRQSIKTAIKRQHKEVLPEDIQVKVKKESSKIDIVYVFDSSGSMKGDKLFKSKKAGIALAYNTVKDKNRIGLIVFNSDIKKKLDLTNNFFAFLKSVANVSASGQTNISKAILSAVDILNSKNTKHIILLSDALSNVGAEKNILESVSIARSKSISISVIGMSLNDEGKMLARKIVDIGNGRLYAVNNDFDSVVLDDYYSLKKI